MNEFNDNQHWQYPPFCGPIDSHWHLHDDHHVPVVSLVGQGPKGDKGDPLNFDNLTEEQIERIYKSVGYKMLEGVFITVANPTERIHIPIEGGYEPMDILFVDVNGLDLAQGVDYTIDGDDIVLSEDSVITHVGARVHFRTLRCTWVDSEHFNRDYQTLNDMLQDTTLVEGDICHVQSVSILGDEGMGWYIVESPSWQPYDPDNLMRHFTLENGLFAWTIPDRSFEKRAFAFDTVAQMKACNYLTNVSICHTNGFYEAGDGGAAWYEIVDTGTNDDVYTISIQNNLFAKFVKTDNEIALFNSIAEMQASTNPYWVKAIVNCDDFPMSRKGNKVTFKRVFSDTCTYYNTSAVYLIPLQYGKADPQINGIAPGTGNCLGNLQSAATYVNREDFEYAPNHYPFGGELLVGSNYGIQCSGFVQCYLQDITFNDSVYTGKYRNALGHDAIKMFSDSRISGTDDYMATAGIGYAAIVNGFAFVPKAINDLKIGDIIMYSYPESEEYANTWRHLGHCGIVVGIDVNNGVYYLMQAGSAPADYIWNSQTESPHITSYPFTFTPGGSSNGVIDFVARFPFGSQEKWNLVFEAFDSSNITKTLANANTQYNLLSGYFFLNKRQLYKMVVDLEEISGPVRINVVSDTTLYYGEFSSETHREMLFVAKEGADSYFNVAAYAKNNNTTLKIKSVRLETVGTSRMQIQGNRFTKLQESASFNYLKGYIENGRLYVKVRQTGTTVSQSGDIVAYDCDKSALDTQSYPVKVRFAGSMYTNLIPTGSIDSGVHNGTVTLKFGELPSSGVTANIEITAECNPLDLGYIKFVD